MKLNVKTNKGISEMYVKDINELIKSTGLEIIDNYSHHQFPATKNK